MVIGKFRIAKAWTVRDGLDRPDGWDLFEGTEWAERYETRREAAAAARAALARGE